jgi:hypothetical protein
VLKVIIDHRQLNAFLASLSESEWPLQVIRVNVQMMNPDELASMSGRTGTSTGRNSYNPMSTEMNMEESPGSSFGNRFQPGRRPTTTMPSTGRGNRTTVESQAAQLLSQQAMRDPFLAEVCVGGLMTLFKPSTAPVVPETPATPANTETPAAPLAETPEVAPTADPAAPAAETPADPAATPEAPAAAPVNPVVPADAPATTPTEPAKETTPAPGETTPPPN